MRRRRRTLVLDQPVVVAAVRVADDVVQHDQTLEFELKLSAKKEICQVIVFARVWVRFTKVIFLDNHCVEDPRSQ